MPVDISCLTSVNQVLNTAFTQSDLQFCIYMPIVFCCDEMINSLI